MKIIAFGHQKGVGKDTAASFLNTILRIAVPHLIIKHISFAGKLKNISFQLFSWGGLERAIYYESHPTKKEINLPKLGCAPRDIWIGVGNKMREMWPSIWIDCALKGTKADIIIISDLRFENEAIAIRKAKGTLIKIVRDNISRGTDPAETSLLNWTDWDQIINNNGSLDNLNNHMEILAKEILEEIK